MLGGHLLHLTCWHMLYASGQVYSVNHGCFQDFAVVARFSCAFIVVVRVHLSVLAVISPVLLTLLGALAMQHD